MYIYLFIPMYIYLSVRNALPMIPLSQLKLSYIDSYLDFIGPNISLVITIATIFKLILFQYDTSLTFVVLLISVVNLFLNSRHLWGTGTLVQYNNIASRYTVK